MNTHESAPTTVLPSKPLKAAIFDWDGVIADSLGLYIGLYQQVCQHFGRGTPPSHPDEFRRWYQPRWEQNYLAMGYTAAELEAVLDYAGTLVSYQQTPLYDEVLVALEELRGHALLGICSTSDSRLIQGRLEQAGLASHFAVIVGGEDGGSDKVERFGRTARLLGVDHAAAVAIGDTPHDVECGRHWGMTCVGVTYGWCEAERVAAAGPDHLLATPAALRQCLKALFGLRPHPTTC